MGKDRDERKKKDKVSKSDKKEKKHRKEKHKKDSKEKDKDKHHRHRKDHAVVGTNNASTVDSTNATVPLLTVDDFYLRHEEFRVWLHLKERSFEDLSSEQAHQVFEEEFIKQFNKGKLPSMFYPQTQIPGGSVNSIPTELREAAMKTKHKWNLKVTDRDRQQQEQVSGEVSRKTRVNTDNAWVHMAPAPAPPTATGRGVVSEPSRCTTSAAAAAASFSGSSSSSSSSKPQVTYHQSQSQSQQSQQFARQKAAASEYLDNHAAAGSSDRREATMQKRDAVGQKMHAASRYQEESRDGLDVLDEQTVMGTDGEDFAAARARLARGQGNKQAKQASRATELMAREEERKQQFMASLGVDLTKGPIRIQPRNE